MPVKLIIDLQAAPGKGDELTAMFHEVLPDTRSFDGCIDCAVWRNRDDADQLSIVETFESREKYDAYFAWRVEVGTLDQLGALLAGAPTMRYFDDIGA
mgnify:CR=1 FL=1